MRITKGLLHPQRLLPRATPGYLGAVRFLVVGIVLGVSLWEDLASSALLPASMRDLNGLTEWAHAAAPGAVDWFMGSYWALRAWELFTTAMLWAGLVGFATRWTVALGFVGALVQGAVLRSYGQFYHSGIVALYVLAVVALSPCGDGFSVDRLIRLARGKAVPPRDEPKLDYAWSVYAVWMVVAISYVMAGACKLRDGGLAWFHPDAMRAILLLDNLKPMQFPWQVSLAIRHWPDWFFTAMAISAVALELVVGLVLVSKVARMVLPVAIAGMHVGIVLLQRVLFADLILMQAVFYDWGKVRRAVGRHLVLKRGHVDVLYDGNCPLCRRTVGVLGSLDFFDRLRFVDFRRTDVAEYSRGLDRVISAEDVEREMYVVRRGHAYAGYDGYVALARVLPLGWVVWPVLALPGVGFVGRKVYAAVAARRLSLLRCDDACPIERGPVVAAGSGAEFVAPARWPWNILALGLGLCLLWAVDVDQYPLTSMPMYSKANSSGVIQYGKLLAHLESGEVVPADPSSVIWAVHEGRYRKTLRMMFDAKRRTVSREFLERCGRLFNDAGEFPSPVVSLEVQWWKWNFVAAPNDPDFGEMVERAVVQVPRDGARAGAVEQAMFRGNVP